jgi:hypothetical protein
VRRGAKFRKVRHWTAMLVVALMLPWLVDTFTWGLNTYRYLVSSGSGHSGDAVTAVLRPPGASPLLSS